MKKLGFILVSCLLLIGCKTKQVNSDKLRVEQTESYDYSAKLKVTSNGGVITILNDEILE